MALTDSLPTGDAGGLTVTDERLILSGLVAKNADGSPRVGVFPAGTGALVTGRASMGYDIAPFRAATSRTGTGVELLANDATVINVPTDPAPGANSRLDVIYARAQFTANADPGNVPIFGVAKGAAAAVPTKPPIPAGALELAVATIPSSAATTASVVITQSAPWTAAAGGVVPVRNATELAAFAAADTTLARDISTGVIYARSGGAWVDIRGGQTVAISSFSPNWSATAGYAPVVVREGKKRTLLGAASRGAGGSLAGLFTLSLEDRPAAYAFLGAGLTSAGVPFQLRIAPTGVVDIPYGGGTATAAYPLMGTWWAA